VLPFLDCDTTRVIANAPFPVGVIAHDPEANYLLDLYVVSVMHDGPQALICNQFPIHSTRLDLIRAMGRPRNRNILLELRP